MPSKRNQTNNAFYWFMQDILPELRREGRVFPNGLQDVVPVAHPRWKELSDKDKQRYVDKANQEKQRSRHKKGRLDNLGNVIADRKDPEKELEKRNIHEARLARKQWPADKDVKDTKFYFISFEYLCKTEEGNYLPCEMAMIEWSMTSGISKILQKFIEPGQIPLGYRFTCESHSQETHHIPVKGFDLADGDYTGIWIQMENFINPNGDKDEYPPLYCLDADRPMVMDCLDSIFIGSQLRDQGNRRNRLIKLYAIEVMVTDLYSHVGSCLSNSSAISMLTTSAFDYEPNTVCKWHEEEEVKYCALGTVKKYAYALADALSDIYEFELTSSHLPTRPAQPFYSQVPTHAFHNEPRGWNRGPTSSQLDRQAAQQTDRLSERRQQQQQQQQVSDDSPTFPFQSTDIRIRTQRQPRENDTAPLRQPTGDSVASRLAASSSYTAPVAPWCKPTVPQTGANADLEFPSLGDDNGRSGEKFAGRSGPPSSCTLPKPAFNSGMSLEKGQGDPTTQPEGVLPQSTINEAAPVSSTVPNAWSRGGARGAVRGTRGGRGTCWAPGGVRQPQPQPQQMAGVGRGLWVPAAGRSSGAVQPTVRNPPPGFGRGLAAQLAGLTVNEKPGQSLGTNS